MKSHLLMLLLVFSSALYSSQGSARKDMQGLAVQESLSQADIDRLKRLFDAIEIFIHSRSDDRNSLAYIELKNDGSAMAYEALEKLLEEPHKVEYRTTIFTGKELSLVELINRYYEATDIKENGAYPEMAARYAAVKVLLEAHVQKQREVVGQSLSADAQENESPMVRLNNAANNNNDEATLLPNKADLAIDQVESLQNSEVIAPQERELQSDNSPALRSSRFYGKTSSFIIFGGLLAIGYFAYNHYQKKEKQAK